jgi:rod shape-determining protein MreC
MAGIKSFLIRHKRATAFITLIFFSVLLLLISGNNLTLRPKEIGQSFFSIFQISFSSVSRWVVGTFNSIGELREARVQLEDAREKLLESERILRDIVGLRLENQQFRDLLGFSEKTPFKNIPAEVIARQPNNDFSLLTVNRGERDGIRRLMPVVAQSEGLGGLVGKVVSVGFATATVMPIFNQQFHVAARVERSRYDGICSGPGENSTLLLMSYVSKAAIRDVQYGDMVLTSGQGSVFPKGIPIGRIRTIRSKGYETSIDLEIDPIIDFSRLEYVLIIDEETE